MWIVTTGRISITGSGHGKGFKENVSHREEVAFWHEESIATLLPNGESHARQLNITTKIMHNVAQLL